MATDNSDKKTSDSTAISNNEDKQITLQIRTARKQESISVGENISIRDVSTVMPTIVTLYSFSLNMFIYNLLTV